MSSKLSEPAVHVISATTVYFVDDARQILRLKQQPSQLESSGSTATTVYFVDDARQILRLKQQPSQLESSGSKPWSSRAVE
jgi:hypothetical protein